MHKAVQTHSGGGTQEDEEAPRKTGKQVAVADKRLQVGTLLLTMAGQGAPGDCSGHVCQDVQPA